jgi:uncharacterized membrane protein
MSLAKLAFRLVSLVALTGSAALLVDELRPRPLFCPFRDGCAAVTSSPYGKPLGIPLPALGLAAFGTLFALSLFQASKPGVLLTPLAVAVGLIGLSLIGVQIFVLEQTCQLCLTVDAAAVLLATLGIALFWTNPAPATKGWHILAWGGLALLAVGAPLFWWGLNPVQEVPAQIKALWRPGKVNVVEITDFACRHCRKAHWVLRPVLQDQEKEGTAIHLVRLVVPLDYHLNSRPAARGYLCAARQGKGESMADALFNATDLSPGAVRQLAAAVGCNLGDYDVCLADQDLDRQIDDTARWVKATHPTGLPDTWIQDQLIAGNLTPENLRLAFQHVEGGSLND